MCDHAVNSTYVQENGTNINYATMLTSHNIVFKNLHTFHKSPNFSFLGCQHCLQKSCNQILADADGYVKTCRAVDFTTSWNGMRCATLQAGLRCLVFLHVLSDWVSLHNKIIEKWTCFDCDIDRNMKDLQILSQCLELLNLDTFTHEWLGKVCRKDHLH